MARRVLTETERADTDPIQAGDPETVRELAAG